MKKENNRWIPVTEAMPPKIGDEYSCNVLINVEPFGKAVAEEDSAPHVYVGYYLDDEWWSCYMGGSRKVNNKPDNEWWQYRVTAWMPLPKGKKFRREK